MSFPRYPAYKDSGVEWLTGIPAHWSVRRLKYSTTIVNDRFDSKPDEAIYLGLENIESQTGRLLIEVTADEVESVVGAFQAGDVLFGKLRPYLAKVVRPKFAGVCTTELLVIRGIEANGDFLFYQLLSEPVIKLVDSYTYGSKMPRVNAEQIGNTFFPLPPLPEQRAIAAFLDAETARIDALVAKQEALIATLQEKRRALISHAVTKGLDPNVLMKDSGVPWLGEVPAHWAVRKIKYFAQIGNGSTPFRDNLAYWQNGTFPWLTSTVVNDETIGEPTEFVTELALKECHLPIVKPGSILVAITGQGKTRGMAALLNYTATINQHMAFIEPKANSIDIRFFRLVLSGFYEILRMISEGSGSTKGALTCEDLANFSVPVPDLNEQQEILAYVDAEVIQIDTLIAKAEQFITLLREHRAALIAAAVTGQIDVRGYMASAAPSHIAAGASA